jgi:hypothetical protein
MPRLLQQNLGHPGPGVIQLIADPFPYAAPPSFMPRRAGFGRAVPCLAAPVARIKMGVIERSARRLRSPDRASSAKVSKTASPPDPLIFQESGQGAPNFQGRNRSASTSATTAHSRYGQFWFTARLASLAFSLYRIAVGSRQVRLQNRARHLLSIRAPFCGRQVFPEHR